MNKPVRNLGIAGSLRCQSYNRAAPRAATIDGIPPFSEDDEQDPPPRSLS